jgi:hypothetical protein
VLLAAVSGQAELCVNSAEGQSLTLRIVEPGEVFCLSPLIAVERYPVMAETLCPSQEGDLLDFKQEWSDSALHTVAGFANRGQEAQGGVGPSRREAGRGPEKSSAPVLM